MKNHIIVPRSVLQRMDSDWCTKEFSGYDLLQSETNVFEMDKDSIRELKNESLKMIMLSKASTNFVRCSENTFDDCDHKVTCEVDEDTLLKSFTVFLKPKSLLEKKIKQLFVSGSIVIPNSEFSNDSEIWKFVEKLYGFCISKKIYLIARYFRQSSGIFDIIKKYRSSLTICTLLRGEQSFPFNVVDRALNCASYDVKKTTKPEDLHQREIVFQKIIVNLDTDFSDVSVSNKTWQMSVLMSDSAYSQKVDFVGKLKREPRR